MNKYYVVEMVRGDEFTNGCFDTLDEAIAEAKHTWTHMNGYDRNHTEIEVRQYVEDIEDDECDCFDYNTFTWWTCRDHMRENGGNLEWCKPYEVDNVQFAVNEGKCCGMMVDGKESPYHPEAIKFIAQCYNDDYDLYEGREDLEILIDVSHEMDCEDCPFFDECEAMDEEYMM